MRLLSTKKVPPARVPDASGESGSIKAGDFSESSGNFQLKEVPDYEMHKYKYAIFSHTWGQGEVTFQDMAGDGALAKKKPEYKKMEDFCNFASKNYDWVWMDTCCIDKTNSVELSETLNSMYRWYQEADICYAYLGDISSLSELKDESSYCKWFTRAWTLQELIAPKELQLLSKTWGELGSRMQLRDVIASRTGIPISLLTGEKELDSFSIAQKMSWAANREATRIEDRAYSLMGLFGVHMSMIYGEKEASFIRLQKEILQISDDHSLFAWRSTDRRGGLLAMSPSAFAQSADIVPCTSYSSRASPPLLSSRGLNLEVRFMGAAPGGVGLAILPCKRENDRHGLIAIYVRDLLMTMAQFERVWTGAFEVIDLTTVRPTYSQMTKVCVRAGHMTSHGRQVAEKWHGRPKKADLFTKEDFLSVVSNKKAAVILARSGDIDRLWLALTSSVVNIESRDEHKSTALDIAAETGRDDMFKLLLEMGAIFEKGWAVQAYAPLSLAAESGYEAIVDILLERDVNVNKFDHDYRTPLSYAAIGGHEGIAKSLIRRGAEVNGTKDQEWTGQTPLVLAVHHGHEAMIRLLIEHGAFVQIQDRNGKTALHWAAKLGHQDITNLLLKDRNVSLACEDRDGDTPLMLAAEFGHELVLKILLRAHETTQDIKASDGELCLAQYVDFARALSWAVSNNHEGSVGLLLDAVARASKNLEKTLAQGHFKFQPKAFAKLLLDRIASTKVKHKVGQELLRMAAEGENLDLVRFILGAGVKPESGELLILLVKRKSKALVKLLLDYGAATEVQDYAGRTPLLLAAEKGNFDMVKWLLDKGANTGVKDDIHSTPLHWAVQNRSEAMVELLLDRRPDENYILPARSRVKKKLFSRKMPAPEDSQPMKTATNLSWRDQEAIANAKARGEKVFDMDPLSLAKQLKLEDIVKLLEGSGLGHSYR